MRVHTYSFVFFFKSCIFHSLLHIYLSKTESMALPTLQKTETCMRCWSYKHTMIQLYTTNTITISTPIRWIAHAQPWGSVPLAAVLVIRPPSTSSFLPNLICQRVNACVRPKSHSLVASFVTSTFLPPGDQICLSYVYK